MKAFHNEPELKAGLIREVEKHRLRDQIIKGTYGKMNGKWKGCAVGCSIRSYNLLQGESHETDDHKVYEGAFGIPEWLALVEDVIFEGLPTERAMLWPGEFLGAINPGADLDKVKKPFVLFILRSNLENFDHEKFPDVKAAIDGVIALYESDEITESAWSAAEAARSAAWSAAWSAWSAAWSAWSAEAAWSAARSAAWSAWSAARSAWSAARSAWSAAAARSAALESRYVLFADKLIELLKAA